MDAAVIEVEGLQKRYGQTVALDGVDLTVGAGTVHGVLGPNGAGKSTMVRVLTTLTRADGGRASVAGRDVARDGTAVRRAIGFVGQSTAVDEILSGRQNLVLIGRLHGLRPAAARQRATELLTRFDLLEAADRSVSGYSGGMRRRLDLALGLVATPEVLFLDEPTTGLDPRGRAEVWSAVRDVAAQGTTVLLTTQYLEEADRLASMITVVDRGRVVAEGTPDALKREVGSDRVVVTLTTGDDLDRAVRTLGTTEVDREQLTVTVEVGDRVDGLVGVVRSLDAASVRPSDVALRRPTLDEAFLALTGTSIETAEVAR